MNLIFPKWNWISCITWTCLYVGSTVGYSDRFYDFPVSFQL